MRLTKTQLRQIIREVVTEAKYGKRTIPDSHWDFKDKKKAVRAFNTLEMGFNDMILAVNDLQKELPNEFKGDLSKLERMIESAEIFYDTMVGRGG